MSLLQREPQLFQRRRIPAKGRGKPKRNSPPNAKDGKPMSQRQIQRMNATAKVTKFPPSAINTRK